MHCECLAVGKIKSVVDEYYKNKKKENCNDDRKKMH